MATSKTERTFRCPTCKRKGKLVIAESDHPYNVETWVDEITDGFKYENLHQFSVDVRCVKCDKVIA